MFKNFKKTAHSQAIEKVRIPSFEHPMSKPNSNQPTSPEASAEHKSLRAACWSLSAQIAEHQRIDHIPNHWQSNRTVPEKRIEAAARRPRLKRDARQRRAALQGARVGEWRRVNQEMGPL
jgi:hypothetical protein